MTISLNPLFAPTIPDGGVGIRAIPLFTNVPRDWTFGCNFNPLFSTERVRRTSGIILDPLFEPGDTVKVLSYPISTAATGFTAFVDAILGRVQPGALTMKLFTNDVQVTGVSSASAFIEMAGHGYIPKALTPTDWFVAIDKSGQAEVIHPPIEWKFTSGATIPIYGYYAVDTDGILRWAGRFVGVVMNGGAGDSLMLRPSFTFGGK